MRRVEQRISPAGFARLQRELLRCQNIGYGPDACAASALHSVGLNSDGPKETVFIVDPKLDGPVYPFMDWPR